MIEIELYGVQMTLEKRGGRYVLKIGDIEYEADSVEELAVKAKGKVVELCGAKCRGAEDVVEAFLKSELKLAAEELRDAWRTALVDKWRSKYAFVEAVEAEDNKVWVYAHDYRRMIVKEYSLNVEENKVSLRGKLIYCGPVIVKSPRGYYIFTGGRLTDVVESANIIYDVLVDRLGDVGLCYDADEDRNKIPKIPAHRARVWQIAAGSPFYTSAEGTIDWSHGEDLMRVLREGGAEEAAKAFKAREEVLKKYYGENYYPALATESLYVAASLIHLMKKLSRTTVASWVYVYGAAGLGKSILAKNLVEMWCTTEECEEVYMPYVAGPLNENRLRNAVDMEGPAFIADEQDRESVVKLLKMLGSATSDIIGVHAAKYGKGFGAVFKVRRGILIITNVPASDAVAKVDAAIREAVKRRLLIVPWAAQKIDKEVAKQLIQELRENTVGVLKFVSEVYNKCDKLKEAADLLELAKAFWTCASRIYDIDYSERLKALEWVESIQREEKVQNDSGELEELWAVVKAYYKTSSDVEALLKLLDDRTVVEYTEGSSSERWNDVFRRICGQGVYTDNPVEAFAAIATCLYNIQISSQEEAERVLGRADVELLKKITSLKTSGRYPWVKAPSWLIPHKRREVAGVKHVRDYHRNIYRYDLIAEFLVMLYTSKEEKTEEESTSNLFTNEQAEIGTTGTTSTTGSSHTQIFNSDFIDSETIENSAKKQNGGSGSTCSTGSTKSALDKVESQVEHKTNVNESHDTYKEATGNAIIEPLRMATPNVVDIRRVAEIAAKDAKLQPEALIPVVEKTLQYFDTYPSVGEIRAVIDLERISKADRKAVKAVLDTLVTLKVLQRVDGVYNYLPKTSLW